MVEVQGKLNNIMVDTDSAHMYQTIPGFLLQINCNRMVRHVQYILYLDISQCSLGFLDHDVEGTIFIAGEIWQKPRTDLLDEVELLVAVERRGCGVGVFLHISLWFQHIPWMNCGEWSCGGHHSGPFLHFVTASHRLPPR